MAVPARHVSKTSQRTRRAHMALTAKQTTKCPNCGAIVKSHRVCKECGYYKNTAIIKDKNEERKLLNEYYDLGKLQPSALTGMELYQVSYQAQFKFDREKLKKD